MKKIFFVAGEVSGDQHASEVIRELKRLDPEVEVHAYGGPLMEQAGAKIHFPLPDLASVGLDWIWKVFKFRKVGVELLEICKREKIDTLVLVDFPGFNLRVATAAKKAGIRVIYYIIPQVWAWRAGRLKRMKRDLDSALVIFPFEKPLLEAAGIETEFVGHPLVDKLSRVRDRSTVLDEHGLRDQGGERLIGLLPGSRNREVDRLLPVLLEAASRIQKEVRNVHFVLPLASSISLERVRSQVGDSKSISIVKNPSDDFRSILDFSITKSGTSTLENAVMGVPQIVIYKGRPLDAWIARRVVRVQWLGLVNLIAGREICPELLQEDCTAEAITAKTVYFLNDKGAINKMVEAMTQVRASLGESGASERAAKAVLSR
ncbi:MAG: lipid-A-disaccharide synthase, partial [Candidatus Omnitrophica bacterium]|nr:lipid-A-disaccharide synthase [Candidatus Omnitrophota bacterium]